jgi:hypothetical protein
VRLAEARAYQVLSKKELHRLIPVHINYSVNSHFLRTLILKERDIYFEIAVQDKHSRADVAAKITLMVSNDRTQDIIICTS